MFDMSPRRRFIKPLPSSLSGPICIFSSSPGNWGIGSLYIIAVVSSQLCSVMGSAEYLMSYRTAPREESHEKICEKYVELPSERLMGVGGVESIVHSSDSSAEFPALS